MSQFNKRQEPHTRPGRIRTLCVYCGSRSGRNGHYTEMMEQLGRMMTERGIDLVYGAGSIGLMGVIARTVKANGGKVTGVIPEHLHSVEIAQGGLDAIHVVETMHQRKKLMFDLSDAFLIMPGGLGTLDEMFEMMTWAQLGLHGKSIHIVNSGNYWQPLIDLIHHIEKEGFASNSFRLLTVHQDLESLFKALDARSTGCAE